MREGQVMAVPAVYFEACKLLQVQGHKAEDLKARPECVFCKVDDHWSLIFNPHEYIITLVADGKDPDKDGMPVPPFTMLFSFNTEPFGIIDYRGGHIVGPELSNEDDLLAAIKSAINLYEGAAHA